MEFSKKEAAEICNRLNHWEWDGRLGKKPDGWDEMPNVNKTSTFSKYHHATPYLKEVRKYTSKKECLKHLHLHYLGRSRWQFEKFWLERLFRKYILIDSFYWRADS